MPARSASVVARASGARLHIVTGKGGTGKTTVAAAVATAKAAAGQRVLLCEVEGRQGLARLFGRDHIGYTESVVAEHPSGGQVSAASIEPQAALGDYLNTFYRAAPVSLLLQRTGAVDFVTTIAPGLRDVLLTGKVYEATRRRVGRGRSAPYHYDAVIMDAPPTGRIGAFLNVTKEVSGLAKVGPIHHQATSIAELLRSSATVVHIVTLLEEMPVQETIDAVAELRGLGISVGAVVANQVWPGEQRISHLADVDDVDLAQVRESLMTAGLVRADHGGGPRARMLAATLIQQGAAAARRQAAARAQRDLLDAVDTAVLSLPELPGDVNAANLGELAEAIGDQCDVGAGSR